MLYDPASNLPGTRNPSSSRRGYAWITMMMVVTSLLTAAVTSGAPAGGPNRGGPFRVIDKNGNFVGYTVTDNLVARDINGVWVSFYVHPAMGIFDSDAIYLHYLTTDCSGTPYVTHYSTFSEGTRVGSKLYYPMDEQQLSPLSVRVARGNGQGACQPASNISGSYGVATTVEVDSFGLQLPFKATQ